LRVSGKNAKPLSLQGMPIASSVRFILNRQTEKPMVARV
jgi:hypothetical protein